MALTPQQIQDAAIEFAIDNFSTTNTTANLGTTEIQAAIQAIDTAMNVTLNTAVAVAGGNTTIVAAFQGQILGVAPHATVQQQALLLIYWAKKAAGL